jgi:hypothetical protein
MFAIGFTLFAIALIIFGIMAAGDIDTENPLGAIVVLIALAGAICMLLSFSVLLWRHLP